MSQAVASLHAQGSEGPGVVFIHGFGSDRLSWMANVPAVTQRAKVWAVDLPGHGTSPNQLVDGSIEELTAAVARAVEPVAKEIKVVVGHSLGGAIALRLSEFLADFGAGLILLAPAGQGQQLDRAFLQDFPELQDEESALNLLRRLVARERLIQPAMAKHVLSSLSDERRAALRQIAGQVHKIQSVRLPISSNAAVIWGTEDRINPVPEGLENQSDVDLVLIEGAGHLPQVENPSIVNNTILGML